MAPTRVLACLLGLVFVGACEEATDVAHDVALDTVATQVTFRTPVSARRGEMAFCLEFDLPRDSGDASMLDIALQDTAGARAPWHGDADRTGESTVCLRGAVSQSRAYASAFVSAPRRMLVRRMRWSQPPS